MVAAAGTTCAYLHLRRIGLGFDRLWRFTETVFGPVFRVVLAGRHFVFMGITPSLAVDSGESGVTRKDGYHHKKKPLTARTEKRLPSAALCLTIGSSRGSLKREPWAVRPYIAAHLRVRAKSQTGSCGPTSCNSSAPFFWFV